MEEAAKQVPNLVVLAFIVIAFLRYLRDRDKQFTAHLKVRDESLEKILTTLSATCEDTQKSSHRTTQLLESIEFKVKNSAKWDGQDRRKAGTEEGGTHA